MANTLPIRLMPLFGALKWPLEGVVLCSFIYTKYLQMSAGRPQGGADKPATTQTTTDMPGPCQKQQQHVVD